MPVERGTRRPDWPALGLRGLDARFLLPSMPKVVMVLGRDLDPSRMRAAGLEAPLPGDRPDAVFTPAAMLAEALALGPESIVVWGRASTRRLRAAGFTVERYFAVPDVDTARLLCPVGSPAMARYLLDESWPTASAHRGVRNAVLRWSISKGLVPSGDRVVTVAHRRRGSPAIVDRVAPELGGDGWVWAMGTPGLDDLSRLVVYLQPAGGERPTHVVKLSRVPGSRGPFDRDEAGLRRAAAAGPVVIEHAPALVARLDFGDLPASVETAATGASMMQVLDTSTADVARTSIAAVTAWLVEVCVGTAETADSRPPFAGRLVDHAEDWEQWGAPPSILARLSGVPSVFVHDDLGTWNIIQGHRTFTVIDWEDARADGLPLGDLVYFLMDALAWVDGVGADSNRVEHARRLFRGELDSSTVVFAAIDEVVKRLGLDPSTVGSLVGVHWLRCRRAAVARRALLTSPETGPVVTAEQMAEVWFGDAELGLEWPAWSRR